MELLGKGAEPDSGGEWDEAGEGIVADDIARGGGGHWLVGVVDDGGCEAGSERGEGCLWQPAWCHLFTRVDPLTAPSLKARASLPRDPPPD